MRQAHPRDRKSSSRRGVLARGQLTLRERTTDRQPEVGSCTHARASKKERERERERERYMPAYHTCNDPVNLNLCSGLARLVAARCKSFAEMSLSSAKRKGPACDLRSSGGATEEEQRRAHARARARRAHAREVRARSRKGTSGEHAADVNRYQETAGSLLGATMARRAPPPSSRRKEGGERDGGEKESLERHVRFLACIQDSRAAPGGLLLFSL